jgi:hypothetical protein
MNVREHRVLGLAVGAVLLAAMRLAVDAAVPASDVRFEPRVPTCLSAAVASGAMPDCALLQPERAVLGRAGGWALGETGEAETSWLVRASLRM